MFLSLLVFVVFLLWSVVSHQWSLRAPARAHLAEDTRPPSIQVASDAPPAHVQLAVDTPPPSIQVAADTPPPQVQLATETPPPSVQPYRERSRTGLRDYGYLLPLKASDQLTGAAMNVLSVQCLASKLSPKLVVVEPFVNDTFLGAVLTVEDRESFDRKNNLKMSDIYDIDTWNKVSDRYHYNRLAMWEKFIHDAPQDVILVENQWKYDCDLNALKKTYSVFFDIFNFKVVRTACLNFKKLGEINAGQFKDIVYGEYDPGQVTVIINRLPGMGGIGKWSSAVESKACSKGLFGGVVINEMVPSQRIKRDAEKYIKHYFGGHTEYISLMVRAEHRMNTAKPSTINETIKAIFQETHQQWSEIRNRRNIRATFLGMDVGKYGCIKLSLSSYEYAKELNTEVHMFFDNLYNGSMSYTEWEESFQRVSGVESGLGIRGYVAILQKEIASRGRCLIIIGGGSFQQSVASLYKQAHAGQLLC